MFFYSDLVKQELLYKHLQNNSVCLTDSLTDSQSLILCEKNYSEAGRARVMCHLSCVRCCMWLFNHSKTVRANELKFWHNDFHSQYVMCHVSHVMCLMSCVNFTCHMTHVTFFLTVGHTLCEPWTLRRCIGHIVRDSSSSYTIWQAWRKKFRHLIKGYCDFVYWLRCIGRGLPRACKATYFVTRLESLAWFQQGFWHPSFCRKRNL